MQEVEAKNLWVKLWSEWVAFNTDDAMLYMPWPVQITHTLVHEIWCWTSYALVPQTPLAAAKN